MAIQHMSMHTPQQKSLKHDSTQGDGKQLNTKKSDAYVIRCHYVINRDIVLKPIYGVKFIFNLDTRNFAISNKLGGTTIQGYINRGIHRMRQHKDGDLIKKAYIESGFMDKRVNHWKNLNNNDMSYLSGLNTY